eukprot:TRINITY_DN23201_c0_g1_i1.p1 TRINITY_DN23201_c0_g1~~TRINITY_DN23201_c0_g1_i1.p1  ORF type:complete len:701 (+),score=173.22 TRINITY_DN23201_c0_g1_i1:69-2105(+)
MAENVEGLEWLSDYMVNTLKSPTWVAPIAQFVDERCSIFENAEENKLEYTVCHNEFKELVESLLLCHLLDVAITPAQFDAFCQTGLSNGQAMHRVFVEQLLSVDDFLTFKAMMVKRNADLDRKAALELARAYGEAAGGGEAAGVQEGGPPATELSLSHNCGRVSYAQWVITEGVLAWYDREFVYVGVPDELLGATLFAGPHCPDVADGHLTVAVPFPATVYVLYENSGQKRDGGFCELLKWLPEWVKVGGTKMRWGTYKGEDFWVSVWSRKVAAGATIEIPVKEPWVGNIAVKYDEGDWALYEQQEQEVKPLSGDGKERCVGENDVAQAMDLAQDAERRCERAELEQAIALSLQAEEERLRRIGDLEAAGAVAEAESLAAVAEAEAEAVPTSEPAPVPEPAPVIAPEPVPVVCEEAPAPAPECEPAPVACIEAPPEAPPEPPQEVAPAEVYQPPEVYPSAAPEMPEMPLLVQAAAAAATDTQSRAAIPRMVKLQPLASLTPLPAPVAAPLEPTAGSSDKLNHMRAEAMQRRERAERALSSTVSSAPAPPPMPPPPAMVMPSDEERRQRAEHLKRQRDILVKKRAEERQQQLREYQSLQAGRSAAAMDKALCSVDPASESSAAAGGGAVAAAAQAQPGATEAAQRMRQALTLQLRQSLVGGSDAKISELEMMRQHQQQH